MMKGKKLQSANAVLALVMCAGMLLPAVADETDKKWSVSLGLGSASVSDDLNAPANVRTEDSDGSLHVTLGYQVTSKFSVGLDYVDLGDGEARFTADTTDPDALQAANLDNVPVLGSGMSLNANYAFFNKGDVTVSGMLGLYMWEAELSSVANGNVLNKDVDGTDFTLGLGAEYNFNEQVSSYLKLQRYQLDPNDVNEVQVGMSYRF